MSTAAAPTPSLEVQEYARTWAVSLASAQQAIPGATGEIFTQAPPRATDIDQQDLWIDMDGYRKRKPYIHAAGIVLDRRI